MATATFTITGLNDLRGTLAKLGVQGSQIAAGALYREGERVMTAAKRRTPVATGNLRASGHVLPPEQKDSRITVTMGFGGVAGVGNVGGETNKDYVGYALYVHENLTARHPVGEAKYLERPLLDAVEGMDVRLAAEIEKELARVAR